MSAASKRYAEALLEAVWGEPEEARRGVADQLGRLAEAVTTVFDLRNALENPSYSSTERSAALDAVMNQLELSAQVQTFARLVVERGRANEMGEMAETFNQLLDERAGRVRAIVTSAHPLDEVAAQRIRQALERRTGKTVNVETKVDASLIGGIRAQVGTIVFDGSIRAELDRLRDQLAEA